MLVKDREAVKVDVDDKPKVVKLKRYRNTIKSLECKYIIAVEVLCCLLQKYKLHKSVTIAVIFELCRREERVFV